MLPVMPGFTFPVDHSDASAVSSQAGNYGQAMTDIAFPDSDYSRMPESHDCTRSKFNILAPQEGGH
jgi:hypothetical protein